MTGGILSAVVPIQALDFPWKISCKKKTKKQKTVRPFFLLGSPCRCTGSREVNQYTIEAIQVGGSPALSQSGNENPFKKCSNCGPIFKGDGSKRLVLSNHISLRKNNHTSAFGPIYHTHIVSTGYSFPLLNSPVMSSSIATMWSFTFQ